jgi:hypothetical protein
MCAITFGQHRGLLRQVTSAHVTFNINFESLAACAFPSFHHCRLTRPRFGLPGGAEPRLQKEHGVSSHLPAEPPLKTAPRAPPLDPTVWAATQLGLDPAHLAVRNGWLGGDAQAAICSLRFVLQNHPDCWETGHAKEGMACPAFAKPTLSASLKKSAPVPRTVTQAAITLSPKESKIAKIEQILVRMRQRLEKVEAEVSSMVAPMNDD